MARFVTLQLSDNTKAVFESADNGGLEDLGGPASSREIAVAELEGVATAAGLVCRSLRRRMEPDEITLEIGLGFSTEVGWFFAKSSLDGSLKVKVKWAKEVRQEETGQAIQAAGMHQSTPFAATEGLDSGQPE